MPLAERNYCYDCQQRTGGDCGKHGPRVYVAEQGPIVEHWTIFPPQQHMLPCSGCGGKGVIGVFTTDENGHFWRTFALCSQCGGSGLV